MAPQQQLLRAGRQGLRAIRSALSRGHLGSAGRPLAHHSPALQHLESVLLAPEAPPASPFPVSGVRTFTSPSAPVSASGLASAAVDELTPHAGGPHGPPSDIDVSRFIQEQYTPYDGDASFLAGPTERTAKVWDKCMEMIVEEHKKGVLDCDPHTAAGITSHRPGYIDKEADIIVGFQADAPLKRLIKPKGGWRMVEGALKSYGYPVDQHVKEIFT